MSLSSIRVRPLAALSTAFLLGLMVPGLAAQVPPPVPGPKLPVAAQAGLPGTQSGFVPGIRTIFDLNPAGTPLGEFPSHIKLLKGIISVEMKDGAPMLKASKESEFLIPFPAVLPQNFTLELEVVPKACCNPDDLMIEGTPARNRGVGSAELVWDTDNLQVVGGGTMYQAPMPEDLKVVLPGSLTQVNVSFQGSTIKLYTNGKRLYTLDRRFARGRQLRIFLGGQDAGNYAVHVARLRVATTP